jgi:hypothetical protein
MEMEFFRATSLTSPLATGRRVAWVRIVTYGSVLYYLLSRDYAVFGMMPRELLDFYPYRQYAMETGYSLFSTSWLVDLASLHWIHWLLPFPSSAVITAVHWTCIAGCACVILLGRGPRSVFAITSCMTFLYLEGFIWRSGTEAHSMSLTTMLMLFYGFTREPEVGTLFARRTGNNISSGNGAILSVVLIMFCTYYCMAGFNKVVDIAPLDWLRFDLVQLFGLFHDMIHYGAPFSVLPWVHHLRDHHWINLMGAPLVYLMELSIPVMFFRRRWVSTYLGFFLFFHIMMSGIPCLFTGLILIWLVLLPVGRLRAPVIVFFNPIQRRMTRLLDCVLSSQGCASVSLIPSTALEVRDVTGEVFTGTYAIRRLLWAAPLFWPVMALLYLPFVSQLIEAGRALARRCQARENSIS